MTKDAALKLALEYLKLQKMYGPAMGYGNTTIDDAIIAIEKVLAQPSDSVEKPVNFELAYGEIYKDQRAALVKALAQPERQWVSLTEDEIYTLAAGGYSVETTRLVDKILKGKNP